MEEINMKRKGSLLEQHLAKMLKLVGLNPRLNVQYKSYEIDVFLRYGSQKIAFECKQYEKGNLVVRNLIHQWDSKNKELGMDKIILVLYGNPVQKKDLELAKKFGIIIWDGNKFEKLFDETIAKGKQMLNIILKNMDLIKESSISEESLFETRLTELLDNVNPDDNFFVVHNSKILLSVETVIPPTSSKFVIRIPTKKEGKFLIKTVTAATGVDINEIKKSCKKLQIKAFKSGDDTYSNIFLDEPTFGNFCLFLENKEKLLEVYHVLLNEIFKLKESELFFSEVGQGKRHIMCTKKISLKDCKGSTSINCPGCSKEVILSVSKKDGKISFSPTTCPHCYNKFELGT